METKEYYLKYIFTMNITEDPDFVASWQKVEEALKRLDKIRWITRMKSLRLNKRNNNL